MVEQATDQQQFNDDKIILVFDDTDSREGGPGTGELLDIFLAQSRFAILPSGGFISRHQLLIHPDVPYTSHNSSMAVELLCTDMDSLIEEASLFLETQSAKDSDPGLAVAKMSMITPEYQKELIQYGKKTKVALMSQREAIEKARECSVHLSGHGGTEDGIIGALAGVGLRLSGNDGRVKGKLKLETSNGFTTVDNLIEAGAADAVILYRDGQLFEQDIPLHSIVEVNSAVKSLVRNGKKVIPLEQVEALSYRVVHRKRLRDL